MFPEMYSKYMWSRESGHGIKLNQLFCYGFFSGQPPKKAKKTTLEISRDGNIHVGVYSLICFHDFLFLVGTGFQLEIHNSMYTDTLLFLGFPKNGSLNASPFFSSCLFGAHKAAKGRGVQFRKVRGHQRMTFLCLCHGDLTKQIMDGNLILETQWFF